MVMRTVLAFRAVFARTMLCLIIKRMVFQLLPSMTFRAFFFEWTTIFVVHDEIRRFPVGAG